MRKMLFYSLVLALFSGSQSVLSAQNSPAPPIVKAPAPPRDPAALRTAEGDLSKVDTEKQLIWIKSEDGKELQFSYSKQTEVQGAGDSVEGLAGLSGTHLKIQYEIVGGINNAVKIEVSELKIAGR